MLGKVFGRLTVIAAADSQPEGKNKPKARRWVCSCSCGKTVTKFGTKLRSTLQPVRSCGCLMIESTKRTQEKTAKRRRKNRDVPVLAGNILLHRYKGNAVRRGLPFDLDKTTFMKLVQAPCAYCGWLPGCASGKIIDDPSLAHGYYNGVDRRDNANGYNVENAVTCCRTCNVAKASLSVADFLDWLRRAYAHSCA
jgi:hypothetical protein